MKNDTVSIMFPAVDTYKTSRLFRIAAIFKDEEVDVVWVKDYNEFVEYITENGLPDGICFDNDLGKKLEGYDCAKWLTEYCLDNKKPLPKYSIQSDNCAAYENITSLFNTFNKVVD